ncbi:MAG: hypothetical protein DRO05_07870 [Thermoproteota archaeon]|nr:MAG: hypothetical protein DRO05_07870 [Candidatus Korarchaeota archaeon]
MGRRAGVDLRIDNPEKFISPTHALIEWFNGEFWLRDLDSLNGTFIYSEEKYERIMQELEVK